MGDQQDAGASSRNADPGDLGRRIAERRNELGLTRGEVATRAGMDASYLAYLEERHSSIPSRSTLFRLAATLETTVRRLEGAGMGSPPGAGSIPGGAPRLEVLGREECLNHIRQGGAGRLVFDDERGPVALPVNYRMLGNDLVFRTGDGSIAAAVESGKQVSLETDHLDDALGEAWSVLVTGKAYEVDDAEELRRVEVLGIVPWAGGDRHTVVRIVASEITGRVIRRSA
jgi:nitroimidazol reductase NimA-like FMN-containing flavoprotein (pyridoxamine 5'-phosphate oxidase superfamily)